MFEHVRIAPHRLTSIIATVRLAGGPDGLDNLRAAPYAFFDSHRWRAGQFRGRQRHPYRTVRLPLQIETEFLRGPGHPWRSVEPRSFWLCSFSPLGARTAPSSRKCTTVDPTSDGSNRLRRLMSVGATGATIAKDCFAFRGSTMKNPDGVKNVLLVDHTKGQCRAIGGFKDGNSRSPYMCGELVSRNPEEDNVMVRLSLRADARQRCRTKRSP